MKDEFGEFLRAPDESWLKAATGLIHKIEARGFVIKLKGHVNRS